VRLMERLGLDDDELCRVLDVDPISVITGELDHRPELPILLQLTAEPSETLGDEVLRRWLRATGRFGRPVDLLLARDFTTFEDALDDLSVRGLIIRGGSGRSGGSGGSGGGGGEPGAPGPPR
jgi:hypothetical protein